MKTKQITYTALMAAVMCILGPLSLNIGVIPISFTNLVIYLAIYLIGTKNTIISYCIYYLLGIAGLPVFSGFSGGIGKAVGPTGGYLVAFFVMAAIIGLFVQKFSNKAVHFFGMVLGTLVAYALGTLWFCHTAQSDIVSALGLCVLPFIPGDIIKITVSIIIGARIQKTLKKSGLSIQ